jgi:hypothetical protein
MRDMSSYTDRAIVMIVAIIVMMKGYYKKGDKEK